MCGRRARGRTDEGETHDRAGRVQLREQLAQLLLGCNGVGEGAGPGQLDQMRRLLLQRHRGRNLGLDLGCDLHFEGAVMMHSAPSPIAQHCKARKRKGMPLPAPREPSSA